MQQVQGPRAFFSKLGRAKARILLLDYDGVIAPLANRQLADAMQEVIRDTGTQMILITAGSACGLRSTLSFDPMPEIWGVDGAEQVSQDGCRSITPGQPSELRILIAARNALAGLNMSSRIQHSPLAVSLNLEGLAPAAATHARRLAFHAWRPMAAMSNFQLVELEGGIELRVRDTNPSSAVHGRISQAGLDCAVAYVAGQEAHEKALRCLRPEDLGVLMRSEIHETTAQLWVKTSEQLLVLLQTWIAACQAGGRQSGEM